MRGANWVVHFRGCAVGLYYFLLGCLFCVYGTSILFPMEKCFVFHLQKPDTQLKGTSRLTTHFYFTRVWDDSFSRVTVELF